jgi:hypothetical protein
MKKLFTKQNLYYALYLFIFLVIALELGGRYYLTQVLKKSTEPKFQFSSYRIYSHIPGFTEGDDKGNWIEINAQGFRRSTDVPKKKNAGTYRIFLMGGSAAHGIASAPPYPVVHIYQDQTIDAYLEKMLKAKHPGKNFEVINCAVTGYQVFQHTSYITSELLDYNPDAVIFFDGANDHYTNNPAYDYHNDNIYQFWKPRLADPSFTGTFDYFFHWLSRYSGFARGYMAWREQREARNNEMNRGLVNEPVDTARTIRDHMMIAPKQFLRSIENNLLLLKARNITPVICLQPMLVLRNRNLLSAEESSWVHRDKNVPLLYPVVNSELQELTKKYEVPYVDINPAFNDASLKSKQLFIDYCHLSPSGGELAAKVIFPVIDSVFVNSTIKK